MYFSDIEAFGSASVYTMWCDDDDYCICCGCGRNYRISGSLLAFLVDLGFLRIVTVVSFLRCWLWSMPTINHILFWQWLFALRSAGTKLVKMVTGKPVTLFPTGNRFPEHVTGYRIYEFIAHRGDTTQARMSYCLPTMQKCILLASIYQ